jgi:hypothetical protein
MPSRRMIDPAFWQSETMSSLTVEQRYLFIGLFSNSDDQGRLRAHPSLIRSIVFPYEDVSLECIEENLKALASAECIHLYSIDGRTYLQVINWWKYQNPQWAYPSSIPAPEGWIDRVRCREGGEVMTENWNESAGGFLPNALGKDLPKEPPKPLPEGDAQSDSQGHSIVQSSVSNSIDSGADAPSRALGGRNAVKAELEKHFCLATKLPQPNPRTKAQGREYGRRWGNPLLEIFDIAGGDLSAAKALISNAVERMDGLTFDAPQSILKTARSVHAESLRGNPQPRAGPRDLHKDIDAVLTAMSSHGRHWSPHFDDPFLQQIADQLDWFELGGMYENAARNAVRDAWFKAREKT